MKKSTYYRKQKEKAEADLTAVLQATGWPKGTTEQSRPVHERIRKAESKMRYWELREVKKYCNQHGYTDVYPWEVVRTVSDKCVEIKAMSVEQTKFPEQFSPGGFVGHYHDNRAGQDYKYISNPENVVIRCRWSEAKKQWQSERGRHVMADKPYKFYDYNF